LSIHQHEQFIYPVDDRSVIIDGSSGHCCAQEALRTIAACLLSMDAPA